MQFLAMLDTKKHVFFRTDRFICIQKPGSVLPEPGLGFRVAMEYLYSMVLRLVQFLNAAFPMISTLSGRSMEVR